MKELSFRPLHERVVVKLDTVEAKTASGLYIPEEAQDIANTATVVAIGNLVNTEGEDLNVGDKVLIQKMAGIPVKIEGEDYQLLMKHDIIVVFTSYKI